jgi:hypothetical protein
MKIKTGDFMVCDNIKNTKEDKFWIFLKNFNWFFIGFFTAFGLMILLMFL